LKEDNMPDANGVATMTEVRNYFGMTAIQFKNEWTKLTPESKIQLREGIGNGTESY